MKKLIPLILILALTTNAFADGVYLPNLKQYVTGTDLGGGKRGMDISGTVTATFSEQATVANGGALPAQTKVASGYDGTNVRVLKTDTSGQLQVGVISSTLPTGAATAANQTTGNTSLSSIDGKLTTTANGLKVDGSAVTQPVSGTVTANQGGAPWSFNLTQFAGATPSATNYMPFRLTNGTSYIDPTQIRALTSADQVTIANASIPVTQSGTWNVGLSSGTNTIGSVKITDGTNTATVLATGEQKVSVTQSLPTGSNTIGAVTQASGPWTVNQTQVGGSAITLGSKTSANSYPVVIASDQGAVPTKSPLNSTGSAVSNSSITTTATSVTALTNATEAMVQASDANTANLRVAVGTTCSSSLGIQLQPGRLETFKTSQNLSICSESGTQSVNVQWIGQ